MRARRAFLEMSLPQLGPMNWVETDLVDTSNLLASASWTLAMSSLGRVSVWARTVLGPTVWTTISLPPPMTSWTVERTVDSVTVAALTRNSAPPRNSMPRVRPRKISDATEISSRIADRVYQTLRRPMKS